MTDPSAGGARTPPPPLPPAPPLPPRPEPRTLVWALALLFFGFFMLPTEIHERYIVPAAVFVALLAPLSRRGAWLFAGVTLTATVNQGIGLVRALPWREVVAGAR